MSSARRLAGCRRGPLGAARSDQPADGLGLQPLPKLDLALHLLRSTAHNAAPRDRHIACGNRWTRRSRRARGGAASKARPTSPEARPSVRSPSPHRRCRRAAWRPTCPSVPASSSTAPPQAHPTRVSSLSGPGTRPGIRPVMRDGRRRSRPPCPGFPLPFGHRHSLLGSSFARRGIQSPSQSTYQTRWPGPRRDCHVPHEQDAIGLGAPFHPGTAVLSWPHRPLGQRLPLLNGQSCSPRYYIPPAGLDDDEASSRVHSRSPARSSPHLWSSDGTRTSWA